jgi:hypothetical protein
MPIAQSHTLPSHTSPAPTKACQRVCLFQRTCKTVKNVANLYVESKDTTRN